MEAVKVHSNVEQSKFSIMKSKLQLKRQPSVVAETSVRHETVPSDETVPSGDQPIQSDPAVAVALEAPNAEDDEDIPVDIDQAGMRVPKKIKNQSSHFNRSSPMKLVRVCKSMTPDQLSLISARFSGGISKMKCSKLIPELCLFLMSCFDPTKCVLDFGERGAIPVTAESVARVLDVPMGRSDVPYYQDPATSATVLNNLFGISDGVHPNVASVEKELGPSFPADDEFLSKFVIYCICSVFAPTTAIKVSPKSYPSVLNPKAIGTLNWAKFIVDILCQTANAKDKKNWFKACMPYLMIHYVDSLETDVVHVPPNGARCTVWTNKLISTVADLDTRSDGSFGALPLKSCYRRKISLFNSEPSKVDMFIKHHLPGNYTEEDMSTYRDAVIDMCSVFENSLGSFITSMVDKKKSEAKDKHVQPEAHTVKKTKRRKVTSVPADPALGSKHHVESNEENDQLENVDPVEEKGPENRAVNAEGGEHQEDLNRAQHHSEAHGNEKISKKRKCVQEIQRAATVNKKSKGKGSLPTNDGTKAMVDCDVHGSKEYEQRVQSPTRTDGVSGRVLCDRGDALKHLHIYDSGSQSSTDSVSAVARMVLTRSKKTVSFAQVDTTDSKVKISEEGSPSGRRPVTRSMSPSTSPVTTIVTSSQRRSPRLSAADVVPTQANEASTDVHSQAKSEELKSSVANLISNLSLGSPKDKVQAPASSGSRNVSASPAKSSKLSRFATPVVSAMLNPVASTDETPANANGRPIDHSSFSCISIDLNRKLESASAECGTETDHQRKMQQLVEDCPSFSLGFTQESEQQHDQAATTEEVVIILSNEGSGDSLDKIYASIEMPNTTPSSAKGKELIKQDMSPTNPNSTTPIPHPRRVVKAGPTQKSPYGNQDKKPAVPRSDAELYNKVCSYGGRSTDPLNGEKIIDYGDFYVYLKDLANSVKPTGWLSNSICEVALRVLAHEMAKQKKFVMPLRIATKLREPTCHLDRTVKKAFECTPTYRLDHKDLIHFAVLQNGHYYLITLNLKAGRFEIMDSMRKEGNKVLMADAKKIIGSIKHFWGENYKESKIDISKYKTVHIPTPMQDTTDDCGYFVLKFIESWNGRRMLPFKPSDMPAFRKLYLKKWMVRDENLVNWEELLF